MFDMSRGNYIQICHNFCSRPRDVGPRFEEEKKTRQTTAALSVTIKTSLA